MLISFPYKPGDVVSMKVLTGEEIIGKLESETADGFIISRPLVLAAGPQGMSLAPYLITAAEIEKLEFRKQHIIGIATSTAAMGKNYLEAVSGIKL